jgi:hypothetical protein
VSSGSSEPRFVRTLAPVLLVVAAASGCAQLGAPGERLATQRFAVGTDTGTTPRGAAQLETGVSKDPGTLIDTFSSIHMGMSDRLEFSVGLAPYLALDLDPVDESGVGDMFAGLLYRFYEGDRGTSAAVEAVGKIPSGTTAVSDLRAEVLLGIALTQELGAGGLTGYYQAGFFGENEAVLDREMTHTGALLYTHSFDAVFGAFAELATVQLAREPDIGFGTLGVSWVCAPSLVLDGGVSLGLNSGSPDAIWSVGLTTGLAPPAGSRGP